MKFILAPVFILFSLTVFAQQNHFIYIQSDNQQAFYVKLNKKIMSSSATGYLIIPKLKGGAYDLAIGFPKNEWPEQNVTCTVETTDAGYLLKNFGEKGWGLFNFQTMNLLMADNKPRIDSSKLNDAFASTLSNVVNDPGINKENKEDTVVLVDTAAKVPSEKSIIKKQPRINSKMKPKTALVKKKSTISKLAENKTPDSLGLLYVDVSKGKVDTINVIIPSDNIATTTMPEKKTEDLPVVTTKPGDKVVVNTDTVAVMIPEKKAEETVLNTNTGNETISPGMDSAVKARIKKMEESADSMVVKADPKKTSKTKRKPATVKTDKKEKEQKNDIVKTAINKAPDSAMAIVPEVKPGTKPAEILVDSVKSTQPNNVEEPKADVVKEPARNIETPVKDTVVQKTDANIFTPPVIQAVTPVVIPEKKEEIFSAPPPKEKIVDNGNPNLARPVAACKVYVDDDEYLGLRKKMDKSKNNENEMLYLAHKVFEKKCFNTKQVQRLSLLFSTDAGKYKLLDDAYQYTYDLENFSSLESELKDEYYKRRFRAMLR